MRSDRGQFGMAKFQDEFDVYFARAKLDEQLAQEKKSEEGERRGSLPGATLTIEVPTNHRRALSCKLPSRKRSKKSKKGSPKEQHSPPARESPSKRLGTDETVSRNNSDNSLDNGITGISMNYVTEPTLRAPSPRIGSTKCHSAPHSRSSSWKNKRRPRSGFYNGDSPEQNSPEHDRSRHSSITRFEEDVAAKLEELKTLQAEDALVVRNFQLSTKGVINRGDSFKRKPRNSTTSATSEGATNGPPTRYSPDSNLEQEEHSFIEDADSPSGAQGGPPVVQRVLVIGDRGVGKTALLQQFMTSQYMGAAETSFDDECGKMVTVMVNGEETIIDFIDVPVETDLSQYEDVDGYLLVFSITSKPSYYYVKDILEKFAEDNEQRHLATILVANKGDLVRKRAVSENDPRASCHKYGCKYSEVSAVLNHKIDELLVGLVTQMRLNPQRADKIKDTCRDFNKKVSCVSAKNLIQLLFKKNQRTSKSCDNLLVL